MIFIFYRTYYLYFLYTIIIVSNICKRKRFYEMLYNKPKYSCIFDNGESMQCFKLTANLNFYTGSGKFFTNKDFDDMLLSICSGIKRINLHNLDGLSALYKDMLKKYQVFTDISDDRIDKKHFLCKILVFYIKIW